MGRGEREAALVRGILQGCRSDQMQHARQRRQGCERRGRDLRRLARELDDAAEYAIRIEQRSRFVDERADIDVLEDETGVDQIDRLEAKGFACEISRDQIEPLEAAAKARSGLRQIRFVDVDADHASGGFRLDALEAVAAGATEHCDRAR